MDGLPVNPPTVDILELTANTSLHQGGENVTTISGLITEDDEKDVDTGAWSASYFILPLGILAFIVFVTVLVIFLIRKKRLDKLRHHLMPLYSFDPAEEGEDWEAELLEEGTYHRPSRREKNGLSLELTTTYRTVMSPSEPPLSATSHDHPQLSFQCPL